MDKSRTLELLAPARNCDIARQAIIHGADAVYIGAEAFGARSAATNSTDDIAALVKFAHGFNARVYVTLNTLIYDDELERVERLVWQLYRAGVDALIVQDMAFLRMNLPPIALHASTQCDTRDVAKARFLCDCGFSQIVLARELSLDEIREIALNVDVPLEVFVHGALCVSYSGDCQASFLATGRSANRGECAQMCRLPYVLTDSDGRKLAEEAHYLSLRDMNRIDRLADLAEAGVSSFKIEGRLKDSDYVKNTVAAYSAAIDSLVADSGGKYVRLSSGRTEYKFNPDLKSIFNRNFTSYFLDGRPAAGVGMAATRTPKWIGNKVAVVLSWQGKGLRVNATESLNNGDGLGYFDKNGKFCGFRLNRVDGNLIYPATSIDIKPGTTLYRNRDKNRDDLLAAETSRRVIPLSMKLRRIDAGRISLTLCDDCDVWVELTAESETQTARTPQREARRRVLSKLGDTIYLLNDLDDQIADDDFTAASFLADLRRRAIDRLTSVRRIRYKFDYRRPEKTEIVPYKDTALDRHDNVANHLAERFYKNHGIDVEEKAAEVASRQQDKDFTVMTTRYCLRRELDACLRTKKGVKLPSPLFLKSSGINYRLDFDCANCQMHVVVPAKN